MSVMKYSHGVCEGIFKNGDAWTGTGYKEDGEALELYESEMKWFEATDSNTDLPYITREEPVRIPMFTLTQFVGTWTADDIQQYNNRMNVSLKGRGEVSCHNSGSVAAPLQTTLF